MTYIHLEMKVLFHGYQNWTLLSKFPSCPIYAWTWMSWTLQIICNITAWGFIMTLCCLLEDGTLILSEILERNSSYRPVWAGNVPSHTLHEYLMLATIKMLLLYLQCVNSTQPKLTVGSDTVDCDIFPTTRWLTCLTLIFALLRI